MSIVASGRGSTFELDDDPKIISLAEKELGYAPAYSIEDGIREYIDLIKKYA